MQTADGFVFDYYGIGEFWNCISVENDFGYQVRFFYYKTTSFTGAVAVKLLPISSLSKTTLVYTCPGVHVRYFWPGDWWPTGECHGREVAGGLRREYQ